MSDGSNVLDLSSLLKPSAGAIPDEAKPPGDQRRVDLGVSRAVLAEQAGCSPSAIYSFERGGKVRPSTQEKIEAALAALAASPHRPPQRKMSVAEAGRKGGLANLRRNGRAFFAEIGHKGGKRLAALLEAGRVALGDEKATDQLADRVVERVISKLK